jgi:hypothetical protein
MESKPDGEVILLQIDLSRKAFVIDELAYSVFSRSPVLIGNRALKSAHEYLCLYGVTGNDIGLLQLSPFRLFVKIIYTQISPPFLNVF